MQSSNIPTKIPLPFAYNAGAGYKTTIPTASQIGIVNGRASLNDGFPPLNFVPISSGGVPPFGADVNGILNEITAITQWQQAGGFFFYDSSFSTTIGGYPKGAILQSSSSSGLWISTAENNTTNPDTGGAGWMSLAFEGSQAITVTTADVTVTQLQSAYPVLIISGAKTAARNLILPAIVGEWIIQNNTTGAFTLTAKTAAGTGVTLTQGESTFIYGDGTNILFADSSKVASFNGRVGTVTLNATDVTTALGYTPLGANLTGAVTSVGNATSLGSFTSANLAAALTDETGTGANVFATNPVLVTPNIGTPSAGTLSNCGSLPITGIAGLGTNVGAFLGTPTSANLAAALTDETGTGANVFAISPALTGTPTAPTASTNNASTQIATTAFANPGALFAGNGYQKLPSGLILQWGYSSFALNVSVGSQSSFVENFPLTFPTNPLTISCCPTSSVDDGTEYLWSAVLLNSSSFRFYFRRIYGAYDGINTGFYWFAIGY